MQKYLQSIAEEEDGFSFGKSWRYSEDSLTALLPILRKYEKARAYFLLKEAENVLISDTGQINRIQVKNQEKKPIYIRMGEIFSGKSQERMAIRSYLIMPKEKLDVEVRCVYASKPIVTSSSMEPGGIAPSSFDANLSHSSFKMRSIDQREIWKDVNLYSANIAEAYSNLTGSGIETGDKIYSSSDDLKGQINSFSKSIEEILRHVPIFENQVGLALLDLQGMRALECFDLKDSWKAMRDDIIKKEGENISKIQKESPFEYKAEKAKRTVKDILISAFKERVVFKSKDYRIIGLDSEKYTGEIVEFGKNLLHLVLVRK